MNSNALRFSIAFILFVCLCVAGLFAGYRAGFASGYASGKAKRQSEEPYPVVYDVGDLLRSAGGTSGTTATDSELDFNSLVYASQATVFPDEWESLGGPCTMAPIPWLESLAVNATSGVHDRLTEFFGDLASLKVAVAEARQESEDMKRARERWLAGVLEPAAARLDVELTPIAADIDVLGSWQVERLTDDDSASDARYTFVDEDTVRIATPAKSKSPIETWYFRSPASMGISGTSYVAAMSETGKLVLISSKDPSAILVASRVQSEQ